MENDRDKKFGSTMADTGSSSSASFGPGMEEQHQPLGGMPGEEARPGGIRGMASQAGETLMDTAERQKAAGADFIGGLAEAVRRSAGEFEGQSPQAAHYIRSAADQVETMSDSIRRRDVSQMLADVQSFARQQPTAFLGFSFLAGFAAVRFLRSGGRGSATASGTSWQDERMVDTGRYGASGNRGVEGGRYGYGPSV